jgi:DNA-binding NarL/FixJ family response regulator
MIRVIVADDHAIVRSGIQCTLKNREGIAVIAEANTGENAVLLTQQQRPDILLMDINMPGMDGFSASIQLLAQRVPTKILILTSQENPLLKARLLQRGVAGCLSKNISPEQLIKIIRDIYAGEKIKVRKKAVDENKTLYLSKELRIFETLSDRELQVMLMVGRGLTCQTVATYLCLSKKTVHGYHRDLLKKLGLKQDVEVSRLLVQHGFIDWDVL